MCTCEYEHFACGHEEKRQYTSCKTGRHISDSSESPCGSVDFTLIYSRKSCQKPDCTYLECMFKGWACCQCNKGPNEGHVCKQDMRPWRWDYAECGHRFCDECKSWKEFEMERELSRRQKSHGVVHKESSLGKEAVLKGLHALAGGLKGGEPSRN
ncbi:hypothetical protein FDECE_13804 [Fusarium decemcellulare]|nr:hypothetical protein FDECE_13804 [Fusarium decemcellulare]